MMFLTGAPRNIASRSTTISFGMLIMTLWFSRPISLARLNSAKSVTRAGARRPLNLTTLAGAEGEAEATKVVAEAVAEAADAAAVAESVAAAEGGVEAEGEAESGKMIPQTPPTIRSLSIQIMHKSNAISAKSGGILPKIAPSRIGKPGKNLWALTRFFCVV